MFLFYSCKIEANQIIFDKKYQIYNIQKEDYICDYNDLFKDQFLDASFDCLVTSKLYDIGNDIQKSIECFEGMHDMFFQYNIEYDSERFVLFFSLTKKGNGYLYIPIEKIVFNQ